MAKSYIERLMGEHEKVVHVARQHWFILVRAIFLEIALILLIFAAAITVGVLFTPYVLIAVAIGFMLMLLPIGYMTHDILTWSNREYIITNRRVMQIYGVFNKNVTDSSLDKVNDVKMTQSAFGRLFDYGDVEILTASELGANLFRFIESPVHFKTDMLNAKEKLEHGGMVDAQSDSIPATIAQLDKLRQQGILTDQEFQQKKAALLARL